jgi:hypothetical protein
MGEAQAAFAGGKVQSQVDNARATTQAQQSRSRGRSKGKGQPEALGDKWALVLADNKRTIRSAVLAQVANAKQRRPPKARSRTMAMASGSDGIWQATSVRGSLGVSWALGMSSQAIHAQMCPL